MATFRDYLDKLHRQANAGPVTADMAANMMAATILMQSRPDGELKTGELSAMADKIQAQPAFRQMMKDPAAEKLVRQGEYIGLVRKMAEKEVDRKSRYDIYKRPDELVQSDAAFLKTASEALSRKRPGAGTDSQAGAGGAMLEKQSARYQEMMKQVAHAQQLAERGIQLSGEDTKALIDAVKKYNDAGTKMPGGPGRKTREAFTESMCLLKHYMPEDEFSAYVQEMNQNKRMKEDPSSFTPALLNGELVRKEDLRREFKTRLQQDSSMENAASLVALELASAKGGLVTMADVNTQKEKLLAPGSAFRKAMQDEGVKQTITDLASQGEAGKVYGAINKGARRAEGRAAQWQLNRSKAILAGSGQIDQKTASKHLANIMALSELPGKAKMTDDLTGKGFAMRASEIEKDPSFQRMAARYAADPGYRNHVNSRLTADSRGQSVGAELGKVPSPGRRPARPEARPQEAVPML